MHGQKQFCLVCDVAQVLDKTVAVFAGAQVLMPDLSTRLEHVGKLFLELGAVHLFSVFPGHLFVTFLPFTGGQLGVHNSLISLLLFPLCLASAGRAASFLPCAVATCCCRWNIPSSLRSHCARSLQYHAAQI